MSISNTRFKKGNFGKPKGATNNLTRTVKETVLCVFQKLQDDPKYNLEQFAKKYPKDFYKIAAKLIPQDIAAQHSVVRVGLDLVEWQQETYE